MTKPTGRPGLRFTRSLLSSTSSDARLIILAKSPSESLALFSKQDNEHKFEIGLH